MHDMAIGEVTRRLLHGGARNIATSVGNEGYVAVCSAGNVESPKRGVFLAVSIF
jgi:hypothetical protein